MKLTSYIKNKKELYMAKEAGLSEVVLEPQELARFGTLAFEQCRQLIDEARHLCLDTIIEWDILMTESAISKVKPLVDRYLKLPINAIRLQDPGAINYVKNHHHIDIHLNLESGNHNLVGIKKWIDSIGPRLKRVILSIELPKKKLLQYREQLSCQVELLGLGPILLFYSPRKLLTPLLADSYKKNQATKMQASSEESPHKGFSVLENTHGSFMFHIKDFYLVEQIQELKQMGLDFFRCDLRWTEDFSLLYDLAALLEQSTQQQLQDFKQKYPRDTMRGFYHVNRSDVLFKKLKNHRLQDRGESYLAEVMDSVKGEYLAIMVRHHRGLSSGQRVKVLTPEGKEKLITIDKLDNMDQETLDWIAKDSLAIIPYCAGVPVKSMIYLT